METSEHIAAQVEEPSGKINITRFNRIPDEAKAVYWLWRFACEAGVCGIDVFILQHKGIYAPETHAALVMVNAIELARRLEAAVALALEGGAVFSRLQDQSWFRQFKPIAEFPNWESLVRSTFPFTESLTDLVVKFIKSHKRILFQSR